jgi:gliding motility-associated-like protein
LVNGNQIGYEFAAIPGSAFEFARVVINKGVNSVSNPSGFIGYAYGSGSIESYAFSIGASLENIQYETETAYDFEVEGEKIACLDQEGTWKIIPDNAKFTKFTWNFGDQSPEVIGQEVAHKFVKEGKFKVIVIASTGEARCDSEEKFTFEVEVKKVAAKLLGPTSVCPGLDEFTYSLTDRINFKTALWEVDGGQIISQTDSTITVKWDGINPSASVKATPVAPNGCQGEVQELQVEITDSILPAKPKGQEGICGVQTAPVNYDIPFPLLGKNYSWTVEGGQLISGQNTTMVTVLWNNTATKRRIFYEESSAANPLCFGVSTILEIGDFPALSLEIGEIIQPSCEGDADGIIELKPIGGSGNFIYKWSHDLNLNSKTASGLAAGTYQVELTDQAGCGSQNRSITVNDPEPLVANIASIGFERCFGASDGEVSIDLSGGTPPYQVLNYQSVLTGNRLRILNLSPDQYIFEVVDSKGCVVTIEAKVEGPEELSLAFEEESPGCPGDLSGALRVIPSGGTPPYSFVWIMDGTINALATGLSSGEYEVIVQDANGCELRGKGTVSEAVPQVRMPTGFIPSQGPYAPIASCQITYKLMIYDRWGQLVHSGTEGWDGGFQGGEMPQGVYTFVLSYQYNTADGIKSSEKMGAFTLIK